MDREEFFQDIENTYRLSREDFSYNERKVSTFPTNGLHNPNDYPDKDIIIITYLTTGKALEYNKWLDVTGEFYEDWQQGKFS